MPKPKNTSEFNWMAWWTDMSHHSLEIEGAWIRICCKLHFTKGQLTGDISQWAKLLGVNENKASEIINYLGSEKISDVVIIQNGKITVACRRMLKAEKEREQARLRAERHRQNKAETEKSRKEKAVITMPIKGPESEYYITKRDILEWEEAFPSLDVLSEIKRIRSWNIDNPKLQKTKTGIRRHIHTWLEKAYRVSKPFPQPTHGPMKSTRVCSNPDCSYRGPDIDRESGLCRLCYTGIESRDEVSKRLEQIVEKAFRREM